MRVSLFSPAKINLFLAVTGRRPDGFHDLVSVAAPVDFGDQLDAEDLGPGKTGAAQFSLECTHPDVPTDDGNLVLKAAAAFAAAAGWNHRVHFRLTKRIPVGAGLGGGSSNAVAALQALNELSSRPLDPARLAALATTLGSDCALFLAGGAVMMRGRGERIAPLPPGAADRIRGRRVLLFKPSFRISTPWAYGRMVARASDYLPAEEAEARLTAWLEQRGRPAEELLFNNMEPAVFDKYVAIPLLLEKLRCEFSLGAAMSGSGSACYVLLRDEASTEADPAAAIREAWGAETFVQEARLA